MVKRHPIKTIKILVVLLIVSATQIAMGSFTGSTEESAKTKYSLKNFNKTFYKSASPFSLRAGFQYKGAQIVSIKKDANAISYNAVMRFEKGNTTYIYPYKHTVSVPKFKAPSAPVVR